MKKKKNKVEEVPVKPRNEWAHCGKCGAALTIEKDRTAYICPVCGSLLRLRIVTRPLDNSVEKEIRIKLSLPFVKELNAKPKKVKQDTPRRQKKAEKKLRRAMKAFFNICVDLKDYQSDEYYEIDAQEKTLVVTKKQDEQN